MTTDEPNKRILAEETTGSIFREQCRNEPQVESGTVQGQPMGRREVAVLTGGWDKPYALGLASALMAEGISFDFIGSDDVDGPELHKTRQVNFLNLRGDQSSGASKHQKVLRVLKYYARLIRYAASSKPKVFHIL